MHKATANGGDNKGMNIYEVLKAVGFGNMHTGRRYRNIYHGVSNRYEIKLENVSHRKKAAYLPSSLKVKTDKATPISNLFTCIGLYYLHV